MASNKIVPYCKLVVGRPKLCFGKSIFQFHFSLRFMSPRAMKQVDDMDNMLPGQSSSGLCSVYELPIKAMLLLSSRNFSSSLNGSLKSLSYGQTD